MRLSRQQVLCLIEIANPRAAKLLAEPGDAAADDSEDDRLKQRWLGQIPAADEQDAQGDAESRSKKAWTEATEPGRKQDGRDEDDERAAVLQPGVQPPG